MTIILASTSDIRRKLLLDAGIEFDVAAPRVDEDAIKAALEADGASPRTIADALAEAKARKVSAKIPQALVFGCDQVLDHRGSLMSKPQHPDDAVSQLMSLSGERHQLLSAVVAYENGQPLWRHIGVVRLQMRQLSSDYVAAYVDRNWQSIRYSVGSYKLEEEGMRLFSAIDGDYFAVLGLPMLPLLSWLITRGTIEI